MNWLAHLFLSEPNPAFRIGNLLPDFLSQRELQSAPPRFHPGIECHRRINRFTDAHPIVRRSILRLGPTWRRFGGILTDIFYDHFLAGAWPDYSAVALPEFVDDFYRSIDLLRDDPPPLAYERLGQLRSGDWVRHYADLSGVRAALLRLGQRFRRPVELAAACPLVEAHYAAWQSDFAAFFPELQAHVARR